MASILNVSLAIICWFSFLVIYPLLFYFNLEITSMSMFERQLENIEMNQQRWLFHAVVSNPFDYSIGNWYGTWNGCNCLNAYSSELPKEYHNKLLRDFCTSVMTGCTNVSEIELQSVYKWKGFGLSNIKQNYSSLYSFISENGKDCLLGYRKCGVLDTVGQPLCIKNDLPCPLNRFVASNSSSPPDAKHNYTLVSSVDGGYLYATNDAIDQPVLVEIALSEGDIILQDKNSYCRETSEYILDRSDFYCKTVDRAIIDYNFFKIDSRDKRAFLKSLEVSDRVEKLPGLPTNYFDVPIRLNARNYIGFKKDCMRKKGLKPDHFKHSVQQMTNFNDHWSNAIYVFAVIGVIIQFVILGVAYKTNRNRFWAAFSLFHLFQLIPAVICIAGVAHFYTELIGLGFDSNCSDEKTNQILNELQVKYQKYIHFSEYSLGISIAALLPILVLFSLYCQSRDEKVDVYKNAHNDDEGTKKKSSVVNAFDVKSPLILKDNGNGNQNIVNDYPEVNQISDEGIEKQNLSLYDAPAPNIN